MKKCIPKNIADDLRAKLENGEITPAKILELLPEEKAVLKTLLEGVVTKELGVSVSSEEITKISKISKKIDKAEKSLGNDLGSPTKIKEHIDFFKAKAEMDKYIQSRIPSNKLKVLTGTIGRGMMLASIKSPILNIGSNIEVGFSEALSRRIANGVLKGTNKKLATDFVKMANKIYQETGYDISRMSTIYDSGYGGTRVLGNVVHSQGKGKIRKVGRLIEDVVFKQLMGAPDVVFASAHFADSVNLNARKMAKGNMKKAEKLMNDSMRLNPLTSEGKALREQGILDAEVATWTDSTWASKTSLGIRKILNEVSGDLRAGDYLLPFIKTTANVISTGMDYAGVGIPKAMFKVVNMMKTGDIKNQQAWSGAIRDVTRSGLGLTLGLIIASSLDDDDFIGAYDPSRAQIEQLKNSNYNAFRVGDKWISTDWLGPLSVTVSAMMYARKYGKTGAEKTFQYGKGVLSSAQSIPGISDIYDYVRTSSYSKNKTLEEATGETGTYLIDQVSSRLIPSILNDFARGTDKFERETSKGVEALKAKIPGLRQTLPVKRDIFGNEILSEPMLSRILFGSRVKTAREDKLVSEVDEVSIFTGKAINFTNWDKTSGKKIGQFKDVVGVKEFNKAKVQYGKELYKLLDDTINSGEYEDASYEEKLKLINKLDTEATETIFYDFNFEYDKDREVK